MKAIQMDDAAIARFIGLFLPEGRINQRGKNELRLIAGALEVVLKPIGKEIAAEALLNGFRSLAYMISVSEPMERGEESPAYIATNSHSIHIGIDIKNLEKLVLSARVLTANKIYRSTEARLLMEQLEQFAR